MIDRREFIASCIASRLAGFIDPTYVAPPVDESTDEESSISIASSCSCTGCCRLIGHCPGWLLAMKAASARGYLEALDEMNPAQLRNYIKMELGIPREQWEAVDGWNPTPLTQVMP